MSNSEEILTYPVSSLPPELLSNRLAQPLSKATLREMLKDSKPFWGPRNTLEDNPAYKQCIPYLLLSNSKGMIAHYRRNGTEARLRNIRSIGFGGHVNTSDATHPFNLFSTLTLALQRETREELNLDILSERLVFLGLIHENETPVGQVHWGFVYHCQITDADLFSPQEEIQNMQWTPATQLPTTSLELWSTLAFKLYRNSRSAE